MTRKVIILLLGIGLLLTLVFFFNWFSLPGRATVPDSVGDYRMILSGAGATLVEAQQASRRGDFHQALALADAAERIDPDLPEIAFLRGRVYSDLNQFEEAEPEYRAALALDPTLQGVWMNLGNNAVRQGKYSEAVSLFRKEFSRFPSPELLLRIGHAFEELNEQDSARAAYRKAIDLDNRHAATYARLAQAYSRDGEYRTSLRYMEHARENDSENLDYSFFTGYLLLQVGEVDEALSFLMPVAESWPWHAEAHYNIGQAYMRLGEVKHAEGYLGRAGELQEIEAKISLILRSIERDPSRGNDWAELADAYRQLGRFDKAIEAYTVALHYVPSNIAIRNNAATLHLMNGEPETAIEHYHIILEQDEDQAGVWLNLGFAHARAGDTAKARTAWQRTLELEPGHEAARRNLTAINNRTNQTLTE